VRVLRFRDLVEIDLVNNWTTLNNWIEKRGFPPGHMVGRCRMWTEREVFAWIESQPSQNNAPLKGWARRGEAA
jgi:predicted DNA-binding transcriptional regulator AlpA